MIDDKIKQFELLLNTLPQVVLKIEHAFCAGVYARTMHIPKGVALVGAVHSKENFFVVRRGDIIVYTERGMKRCRVGDMFTSYPGIKRVGFAVRKTIITTFHHNPDELRDAESLWEHYTIDENAILINDSNLLIEATECLSV